MWTDSQVVWIGLLFSTAVLMLYPQMSSDELPVYSPFGQKSAIPSSHRGRLLIQPDACLASNLLRIAGLSVRVMRDRFCHRDFLKDCRIKNSQELVLLQDDNPLFSANQF